MFSELLAELAPYTSKKNRDRFIPFLEKYLPLYSIDTPLRQAAFLATICYESNYFRATKEGRARLGTKARKSQDKYWATGYYGRGLIQLTHERNYRVFFSDAKEAYGVTLKKEDLEKPQWAVVSACLYWRRNEFNSLADRSEFTEIQGYVNRGDPDKPAWGLQDRINLYNTALSILESPTAPATTPASEPALNPPPVIADTNSATPTPTFFETAPTKVQGLFSQLSQIESSVSGSSWATTILTKLAGYAFALIGTLTASPVFLMAGVALILGGLAYLHFSKQRGVGQDKKQPLAFLSSRT
jgi:putative chitinase